jgi:serine protease Do
VLLAAESVNAPSLTPPEKASPDANPKDQGGASPGTGRVSLWSVFIPLSVFLTVLLLAAYAAPMLLLRWRLAEAQGEAELAYLKRQAELNVEAEIAEKRLDVLDRRTHLVSLGFREVVRKVTPLVVNVTNLREPFGKELDPEAKRLLALDPDNDKQYLQTGVGSGLIVKPGLVLTSAHVVRKAERLRVTFASGRSVGVEPGDMSLDSLTDLAIIRLPVETSLVHKVDYEHAAEFADSDRDVERGDLVLAVGSPRGLKQTVTHGIISAKGRLLSMLDTVELLQTDAPLNPGNSGGPLFDLRGRVVGINVAIASDTGANQGIGFVIPGNAARQVFTKLADRGEVVRGFIGAVLEEVAPKQARELGLAQEGGVRISEVVPGLPAEKGGLQAGDVVVRFNKGKLTPAHAGRELRQKILETDVGNRVIVEVLRAGQRRTLTIEIGKRPARLP